MSVHMNAWICERCGEVSRDGFVDELPDNWEQRCLPVRGSTGARSSRAMVLCGRCDDSLYDWSIGGELVTP